MFKNKKILALALSVSTILSGVYVSDNTVKAADRPVAFEYNGKILAKKDNKKISSKKALKNKSVIIVKNKMDNEAASSIFTDKNDIQLEGEVKGKSKVKKVKVFYDNNEGKGDLNATGTKSWSVKVPLKIGTNKIKIVAYEQNKNKAEKIVVVNRTSPDIKFNDGIKIVNEAELPSYEEGFVTYRIDQNGTYNDSSDDKINLLVKQDSIFMKNITEGKIKEDEVFVLPRSNTFKSGFVGVYKGHQSPVENTEYDVNQYADDNYEEISFSYPSLNKLFNKDTSISFLQGISKSSPVAFTILGNQETQTSSLLKVSENNNGGVNLNLKLSGVPLTSSGAGSDATLSGEISITDLEYFGGIEWKQKKDASLPKQILSKTNYKVSGKLNLHSSTKLTSADVIRKLNQGMKKNKAAFLGVSSLGIDSIVNEKWLIGAVGFNIVTPKVEKLSKKAAAVLNPTLVLLLYSDINGNISADTDINFEYASNSSKGFNLQENKFLGGYLAKNDSMQKNRFAVMDKHFIEFFDRDKGEFKLFLGKHANSSLTVGAGISTGLLIGGVSPTTVSGGIFQRATIAGDSEDKPVEENYLEKANINYSVGSKVHVNLNLPSKDASKRDFVLDWENMFWEKDPSVSVVKGRLFDIETKKGIKNITLNIRDKNGDLKQSVTTDRKGMFRSQEFKTGKYQFEIVDNNETEFKYYLDPMEQYVKPGTNVINIGIKKDIPVLVNVSGKVVDALNNEGINDITLKLTVKNVRGQEVGKLVKTIVTDASGNYNFDKLATGIYQVEIEDLSSKRDNKYYKEVSEMVVTENAEDINKDFAIIRDLKDEEIRVVLTWGRTPDDLDSHIFTPMGEHIYYQNKADRLELTQLDLDDTNSYGPETITISTQQPGVYRYKVHNYSNSGSKLNTILSKSNAKIKVYMGRSLVKTYSVPESSVGTVWDVFEYNSIQKLFIDKNYLSEFDPEIDEN